MRTQELPAEKVFTCHDCGQTGKAIDVQPQPDGYALCCECINARNARLRAERKKQLAAMPRCEVPTCSRRATVYHNGTGLCGHHWKRAESRILRRLAASPHGWYGPIEVSRETLIKAATERDPKPTAP